MNSLKISGEQIKSSIFTPPITPKRVTSLWDHITVAGSPARFQEVSQLRWAVGNTTSDLIGQKFEPQISHSKNQMDGVAKMFQQKIII